jgi:hypothetical protein
MRCVCFRRFGLPARVECLCLQGPFGQAHEVPQMATPPYTPFDNVSAFKPIAGVTRYVAIEGGSFFDAILRGFFGYHAPLQWNPTSRPPRGEIAVPRRAPSRRSPNGAPRWPFRGPSPKQNEPKRTSTVSKEILEYDAMRPTTELALKADGEARWAGGYCC